MLTGVYQILSLKLLQKPLGERTPDINKNILKERESRKIKDQEAISGQYQRM